MKAFGLLMHITGEITIHFIGLIAILVKLCKIIDNICIDQNLIIGDLPGFNCTFLSK